MSSATSSPSPASGTSAVPRFERARHEVSLTPVGERVVAQARRASGPRPKAVAAVRAAIQAPLGCVTMYAA